MGESLVPELIIALFQSKPVDLWKRVNHLAAQGFKFTSPML